VKTRSEKEREIKNVNDKRIGNFIDKEAAEKFYIR